MARKSREATSKNPKEAHRARSAKKEEMLKCFYCDGLVNDWNWKCPHCGKLFDSGKRAIAAFIAVILVSAAIGTYPIWKPLPPGPSHALTIDRVTPVPGNTSAFLGAYPTIYFNETHPFDVAMIDRKSCENAFSITPSLNGTMYWMGFVPNVNVMTYTPKDFGNFDDWLKPNTTYNVTITRDCRDEAGNRLDHEWNYWFHTASEWTSGG